MLSCRLSIWERGREDAGPGAVRDDSGAHHAVVRRVPPENSSGHIQAALLSK